jgi:hypothetical protein
MKHPTAPTVADKPGTAPAETTTTLRKPGTTSGKRETLREDLPLFAHAVGQWAKKIRGKMHDFGVRADPEAALPCTWTRRMTSMQVGHLGSSRLGSCTARTA